MKRRAMSRRESKKVYRKGLRVHPKNMANYSARGGIRA